MSTMSLMYNHLQEKVVQVDHAALIPEEFREMPKINGELTTYHVYITTDNRTVWLQWNARRNQWEDTRNGVPEVVKLTRLLLL